MVITRKNALELADAVLENITNTGHNYWVKFSDKCIPVSTCIHVLKQFIENPSLSSMELTDIHFLLTAKEDNDE